MTAPEASALYGVRTEIDRVDRQLVQGIAERQIWVRAAAKVAALAPAGAGADEPDAPSYVVGGAESVDRVEDVEQIVTGVRAIAAELGADEDVVEATFRSMVGALSDLELGRLDLLGAPEFARLSVADAGELLTLQRAAYATEAQIYRDPKLPALVETMPEIVADLAKGVGCKATRRARLVGAVRCVIDDDTARIGRLVVAPDMQGLGLGTALLAAAEATGQASGASSAALFTGHRSAANLRLYKRHGYVEERREKLRPGLTLIHLRKPLV